MERKNFRAFSVCTSVPANSIEFRDIQVNPSELFKVPPLPLPPLVKRPLELNREVIPSNKCRSRSKSRSRSTSPSTRKHKRKERRQKKRRSRSPKRSRSPSITTEIEKRRKKSRISRSPKRSPSMTSALNETIASQSPDVDYRQERHSKSHKRSERSGRRHINKHSSSSSTSRSRHGRKGRSSSFSSDSDRSVSSSSSSCCSRSSSSESESDRYNRTKGKKYKKYTHTISKENLEVNEPTGRARKSQDARASKRQRRSPSPVVDTSAWNVTNGEKYYAEMGFMFINFLERNGYHVTKQPEQPEEETLPLKNAGRSRRRSESYVPDTHVLKTKGNDRRKRNKRANSIENDSPQQCEPICFKATVSELKGDAHDLNESFLIFEETRREVDAELRSRQNNKSVLIDDAADFLDESFIFEETRKRAGNQLNQLRNRQRTKSKVGSKPDPAPTSSNKNKRRRNPSDETYRHTVNLPTIPTVRRSQRLINKKNK